MKRNSRTRSGWAALGIKTSEVDVKEQGRVLRSRTVIPRSQGKKRPQSDDEMGDSDATEADSEPVDEIIALGQVQEDEDEEQEDEEMEEVEELEDENNIDWATSNRLSPKKQTPPREKRRSPATEIIEIEDDGPDKNQNLVDPGGDDFIPNDSPEPVQADGQYRPDHGTSTPNSVSAASSCPRLSIQQLSGLVSDTPRSSVRRSGGSAEYTSATFSVRSPLGSQHQTPSYQVLVPKLANSQSDIRRPQQPTPTASPAKTIQPSAPNTASNSQSSATPRTQASSQPLASPRTGATSLTPQQQSGNWPSAPNPVAPPGAYNELASSQQWTPHRLLDTSLGNKRPAESSPGASYTSTTPSNTSRTGAKRQRSANAQPHHQSQVSRAINWDAVLPSGGEFKESLKNASDAMKLVLHKFEDLLADINDEQRKLSAVQRKNHYTNDQKKAQDALKDVEKSTANENATLRSLEEVYQQSSSDAELGTSINKQKRTIWDHKEVYAVVRSQLDKSIAGIYKTDHETALVTKRLGQLDAKRADVMKEKEGVDKAVKRVTIMAKFMEPSWQVTLDMLLQSVGPEVLEKVF
ncbi:hypothetical protein FANTH_9382 [Fusarium anthophilum]|uniref:Uncharacterized protein n=1 Tax=Fusarium anthophilum TaxID=48485 RepID=A0A8H5DZB9_9HYPO|nr:hypothetical protein FANTH_9382 [Fusarium anthophilum]